MKAILMLARRGSWPHAFARATKRLRTTKKINQICVLSWGVIMLAARLCGCLGSPQEVQGELAKIEYAQLYDANLWNHF